MQIKRLEELAGVQLLERSNQGIQLTEAGETLLSYAEQFLRLNNAALSALSQRQLSGRINFGIPTDYAQQFLQNFMPVLQQAFPHLEPHIVCDRSRSLRRLIQRAELDIAIVTGEPEFTAEELLWSERLIWSAPVGVPVEEREKLPLALFEDDCVVRDLSLDDLKRSGLSYQQQIGSPVMENLAAAVHAGLAVSLLPESLLGTIQARRLASERLQNNHLLCMNLVWSPVLDTAIRDQLADCMRRAASDLATVFRTHFQAAVRSPDSGPVGFM